MYGILTTLAEQFNRKGIGMDQLAFLMDDIELFFRESKKYSRQRLNHITIIVASTPSTI